jgi:hypothetical protein
VSWCSGDARRGVQGSQVAALCVGCFVALLMMACGKPAPFGAANTSPQPPAPSSAPESILTNCTMFSAPGPRSAASLAYQPLARHFLLFGGDTVINGGLLSVAETWLWNGQTWTKNSGPGPSARAYAVMDYDVTNNKVVLYGGQYDEAGKSPVGLFDLWLWDGVQWAVNSSAPAPKLVRPTGAYDVARANLVVFGIGSSGPETWLWNGSQWTAAKPVHSPAAISGAGMAYVASTRQVVLFGGGGPGVGRLNDTWLWDGTDWRHPQLSPAPPPRISPTFVGGQQAILFGGGGDSSALADVWRWDGTRWAQLNPLHLPLARRAAAGASDGTYVVIVGGDSAGLVPGVWRWDGNDWNQC